MARQVSRRLQCITSDEFVNGCGRRLMGARRVRRLPVFDCRVCGRQKFTATNGVCAECRGKLAIGPDAWALAVAIFQRTGVA